MATRKCMANWKTSSIPSIKKSCTKGMYHSTHLPHSGKVIKCPTSHYSSTLLSYRSPLTTFIPFPLRALDRWKVIFFHPHPYTVRTNQAFSSSPAGKSRLKSLPGERHHFPCILASSQGKSRAAQTPPRCPLWLMLAPSVDTGAKWKVKAMDETQ